MGSREVRYINKYMKTEETSRDSKDNFFGNKFIGAAFSTTGVLEQGSFAACSHCSSIVMLAPEYHGSNRRKIRLIEDNAKCRHLKKLACKETYLSKVP